MVGDGETLLVPETDIQRYQIDGLGLEEGERRRDRTCRTDNGRSYVAQHVADELAQEGTVLYNEDPHTVHHDTPTQHRVVNHNQRTTDSPQRNTPTVRCETNS